MMCDQSKVQLFLYLDGELASDEAGEMEIHLRACESCQQELTAYHRLQTMLQAALPEEPVPESMMTTIEGQWRDHEAAQQMPASSGWRRKMAWVASVAAAVVLAVIGWQIGLPSARSDVIKEIVDSQIRAQLMQAPYEKVAPEAGAIRRWFDGQVEFAPPLPAMADETYQLMGVRLNYFLNRRVAELAYASDEHVVSFLTFADRNIELSATRTVRLGSRVFHVKSYKGYNTVLWRDGEIYCSLVSDLHLESLLQVAGEATGSIPAS